MDILQDSDVEEDLVKPGSQEDEAESLDLAMKPFNPTDIDIVVEPKSLDALIKRIHHEEIDMNTDFQRHANLWDVYRMSRLIESILIRFPLPAFYFDASDENKWLIVDGLQRLSTIQRFVLKQDFRLSGLEFLIDLKGKKFDDLPRQYQRRIEECPLTIYMIKPGTPRDVMYSIFRRINTGGLTLNNQEIRNALAKPRDRELLRNLANSEVSKKMLGELSKRMKDQELVLRFWAFYRFNYLDDENKKVLSSFLDRAMEDIKQGDDDYRNELALKYSTAINRCHELLGEHGFERSVNANSSKCFKNSALFEVWMVKLVKLNDSEFNKLFNKKEVFQEKSRNLLNDRDFSAAITSSTQKIEHVKMRYDKVGSLIQEELND